MDSNHRRRKQLSYSQPHLATLVTAPLFLIAVQRYDYFETCKRLGRKIYHFYCGNRCLVPFIAISTSRTILGLLHGVGS